MNLSTTYLNLPSSEIMSTLQKNVSLSSVPLGSYVDVDILKILKKSRMVQVSDVALEIFLPAV